MSDLKTTPLETEAEKTIEEREAAADVLTRQDHESVNDAAGSRPAFDDDQVTPRLNDGR